MELAKAYVQIVPSADGISGKLNEALGGEASSAGDYAGKTAGSSLVSTIKKVVAAAGIGQALKAALTEGANLQQSIGGIETLFKDSSNKVIENAKNAYKTAGMSANEYMESVTGFSASLLQGLSGDTNKAADVADMALTDMSDNANKMGTDMESIQNAYQGFAKQNYTMLDNLKLGYGGTKSEMQRLLADAEKFSGVKYDLNNLSDVYSAIHVIQGELSISGRTAEEAAEIMERTGRSSSEVYEQLGTTAKEASTTFSGSLASMKSAFTNVLGNLALGEDIGPSLKALGETVFTFVEGNLIPMAGNLLSGIPELISGVLYMASTALNDVFLNMDSIVDGAVGFAVNLADAIVTEGPYFIAAAVRVIGEFATALLEYDWMGTIQELMTTIGSSMSEASGEIFGTEGNMIEPVLNSITESLPSVLDAGVEIITNISDGVQKNMPVLITMAGNIVTKMVDSIGQNLPSLLNSGADLLLNLMDGATNNLPSIAATIATVFENIVTVIAKNLPKILESGADILLRLIDGMVKNFPKIATTVGKMIIDMVAAIAKNLPKILQSGIEIIGKLIAGIIKAVPKLIASIPEIITNLGNAFMEKDWGEIGRNIIEGLINGIMNAASAVGDAIKEVANSAIEAAKKALGIHSPSKKFKWIGEMCIEGFDKPLEDYNPYATLQKSMRANVSALQTAFNGSYTAGNESMNYRKMGNEFAKALEQTGFKIVVEKREIGRLVREVIA